MQPITHAFPFSTLPPRLRLSGFAEFAACGHREIVLLCEFLAEMMADPSKIRWYRKALADTGTVFCDSHAPFGPQDDLNCPYDELRPASIARKKMALEIAASFGVDSITIHTGNVRVPGYPLEKYHANLLSALDELLPLAEKLKITIALENIWHPTNTVPKLLDALRRFPSEYLGICYDTGHANISSGKVRVPENNMAKVYAGGGYGEPEWNDHILEDLLPHVTTCHVHDNNGVSDEHLLPGLGTVDWGHVIPLLKSAPRIKCFQNESSPKEVSPVSIARTVKTFRELFGSAS